MFGYKVYEPSTYKTGLELTPENDLVVFVKVYVPFSSRHKLSGALGKLSVNSVIAVLGSQTLDKLRDIISCESDYSISEETSNNPIQVKTTNAKVCKFLIIVYLSYIIISVIIIIKYL